MPKYEVDDELCVRFVPEREAVLADYAKLRLLTSDVAVRFCAFVGRGTGAPIVAPLFLYVNNKPGQLLAESFHWRHRLASSARGKASATRVLKNWRKRPASMLSAVATPFSTLPPNVKSRDSIAAAA